MSHVIRHFMLLQSVPHLKPWLDVSLGVLSALCALNGLQLDGQKVLTYEKKRCSVCGRQPQESKTPKVSLLSKVECEHMHVILQV